MIKTKKLEKIDEDRFAEFPELLFFQSQDNIVYFDATHYTKTKQPDSTKNYSDFYNSFSLWIKAIQTVYDIQEEDLAVIDTNGHCMIEESLALLYVGYMDPMYLAYMIDRINEMHITGLVLSDTTLLLMIRNRFSRENIINIYDYDKEKL